MDFNPQNLVLKHTDKAYPFEERITYDNPMDVSERANRTRWIRDAFSLAGIQDALVMEKTYHIELAFRSYCDYAHFCIADDIPEPHFSRIKPEELSPVCMDFVSLLPSSKDGVISVNHSKGVLLAFKTAAKKSDTASSLDFKRHDDHVVIVNGKNPQAYFKFWKAIPGPLRNTLYLADTPSPA